ncbi:olfactory receptor 14K1-like [Tachyglossus aculeatus]|uniref:olfactory receptor 14K1-like n=1 Tax=Tachyglossus aculeatus TaxID=9261 RepID=UPI0018F61E42|nr:olfactory receptor 14K1-like [Tachyglossus aculeatus]
MAAANDCNHDIIFDFSFLFYSHILAIGLTSRFFLRNISWIHPLLSIQMATTQGLHTPMYLFLRHLSTLDLCLISITFPKFILVSLATCHSISFLDCCLQVLLVFSFATSELFILTAMSYDCYTANHRPLSYEIQQLFCDVHSLLMISCLEEHATLDLTSLPSALDLLISVFYMVAPPALNPLIYSLRNRDIKAALGGS